VLFVLLLVVFSPSLVRMLAAIAPLIPAPQPAFLAPLWVGSANYNLTAMAGHSFAILSSSNYNMTAWTVFGAAGNLSSANYAVQLGVGPMLGVPVAELNWSQLTMSPSSPRVYASENVYTFGITWTSKAKISIISFNLTSKTTGQLINYTLWENVNAETFSPSVVIVGLDVGVYNYTWAALDKQLNSKTVSGLYNVTPGLNLTNAVASPTSPTAYAPRQYSFNITVTGPVSSMWLEWAGENQSATNISNVYTKTFTNLSVGEYVYKWWANDTEGSLSSTTAAVYNITQAATEVHLQLCDIVGVAVTNCVEGNKNYTTVGTKAFRANITESGKPGILNNPLKIKITNATGASTDIAEGTGEASTSYSLDTGVYTVTAWFDGDQNYSASSVSYTAAVNFTDTDAPQWFDRNQSANTIEQSGTISLWANWTDNGALTNATLFINDSVVNTTDLIGQSALTNFTLVSTVAGTFGWRIRACDVSGNCNSTATASFNVTEACVHANPTVVAWPESQTGTGGKLTYNLNITNADTSTCPSSNFTIAATKPEDWSVEAPTSVTNIAPGTIATRTFNVTPAGAAPGVNAITLNVSNAANASYWAAATVTYNVITDNPPTLSNVGQNKTATTPDRTIKLYALCADDFGLAQAILQTNETGTWENKTTYGSPKTLSGTSASANFTWQNASVLLNTSVGWGIKCIDSKGQADTNVWTQSFSVIEPITSYAGVTLDFNEDCVLSDAELEPTIAAYWANPSDPVAIQRIELATALWSFAPYC